VSNETAHGLLARALDDAAAVRAALPLAEVTDGIVGFHAQQAVEKSIKAVLAAREEPFPFTHDLEGLIERYASAGIEVPAELVDIAGLLTPYAVRHRYGGDPPTLVGRESALRLADAAVSWAAAAVAP